MKLKPDATLRKRLMTPETMEQPADLRVLSYGGGRQTAGMLAMMKLGTLPKTDIIIFADTGAELPETYRHMEQHMKPLAGNMGIPFVTVRAERKGEPIMLYDYYWHRKAIPQPWGRLCSQTAKIEPIWQYLRRELHLAAVDIWIGISVEEANRQRAARRKWVHNVYPLVEKSRNRKDCEWALHTLNIPLPPKSACYFCPYQHQERWMETKRLHPDLFQKAVDLEERSRGRSSQAAQYTITGKAPLKTYLGSEQLGWEELLDGEAGCHNGYCFV